MQNLLVSFTGAVCSVFDTVANTADAVNGLSEAARLRSESYARTTALSVELKERTMEFELEIATQHLDKMINDPKTIEAMVNKMNKAGSTPSTDQRRKIERPGRYKDKK